MNIALPSTFEKFQNYSCFTVFLDLTQSVGTSPKSVKFAIFNFLSVSYFSYFDIRSV